MFEKIKSLLKEIVNRKDAPFLQMDAIHLNLIERVKDLKLTYLSDSKIASIVNACLKLEENETLGIFIEAGCALGGSAIIIGSIKSSSREFQVYDVFDMIPPPTEEDTIDVHARYKAIIQGESTGIDGDKYYGYEKNIFEIVKSNFNKFDIDLNSQKTTLVKGLVQDTMKISQPVAFAHIDVDWYEPVMTCLKQIFPYLVVDGCIVLDDYHDWGGCRKATDEYLRLVPGKFKLDDSAGSMKIIRVKI